MDRDIHEKLAAMAKREGRQIKHLYREAVEAYLEWRRRQKLEQMAAERTMKQWIKHQSGE